MEPGGEEKLVGRGVHGFSSVQLFLSGYRTWWEETGGAWRSWIFLYNYFSADTEPGGKKLVAHGVPGFSCIIISQQIRNLVGRNWWRRAVLDFLLCNYFYVDMEPGGEELVAHAVSGFSSQ
jgi:hypothetical protein